MRFGFSIAATRSGVIGAARAAVDNPPPAGIPLKNPLRTVLTSGATSSMPIAPCDSVTYV